MDRGLLAVVAVQLTAGAGAGDRTILSDGATGAGGAVGFGPRLDAPSGLAARTGGEGLYLVSDGATFLVEPTAGDRVVLSL